DGDLIPSALANGPATLLANDLICETAAEIRDLIPPMKPLTTSSPHLYNLLGSSLIVSQCRTTRATAAPTAVPIATTLAMNRAATAVTLINGNASNATPAARPVTAPTRTIPINSECFDRKPKTGSNASATNSKARPIASITLVVFSDAKRRSATLAILAPILSIDGPIRST